MSINVSNNLTKIPLPWKSSYSDNNQLILNLDVNDYYKISIPTGFYCTNNVNIQISNSSNTKKDDKEPIKDSSKVTFIWKKDKIPFELLYKFIRTSADVYNKYKSEFAACIFHDFINNRYELLIPIQKISGASVTYDPIEGFREYTNINNMNMVIDMHSHHTMNIGFSSTDDHSDENVGAIGSISLVIKGINNFNFIDPNKSIDIRLNIQGKSYSLPLDYIFDMKNDMFSFAENFIEKEVPVVVPKITNPVNFYTNSKEKENVYFKDDDPFEKNFGSNYDYYEGRLY